MNSSLRVVHIITGLNQGGAEAMLIKLLVALHSRCEIQVISLLDEGVYGEIVKQMGIPLHCLYMKRGSFSLQAFRQLRNILREIHPDVVQTWMYHGDLMGGLASKTVVDSKIFWNVRQGNIASSVNSVSTRCVIRMSAILSHFVPSGIVVNSYLGKEEHQRIGYASQKMAVIPNAFDILRFKPDEAARAKFRAGFDIDFRLPVLGMVARFDPQKDHETLLEAGRLLADKKIPFFLLLCGPGMDKNNSVIVRKIQEKKLQNHMFLLGARSDIPEFMNALDYHILSSSCCEGFPNVIGEAMACGVPCVTTDVGDSAKIVGDTGWIVPPRDPQALAGAIMKALTESPEERAERGRRCRLHIVENYEISSVAAMYYKLWAQGMNEGKI